MALPPEHLTYLRRGYGMDQDWYAWSALPDRPAVAWPDGNRLALWVTTAVEFFPLNAPAAPFRAPGSVSTPYPDLRHYTLRDYGNRVGVFRLMRVLADLGITPSVAVNSAVAERYPRLIAEIVERGWEVIGGGVDMGHIHHGGLDPATEAEWIAGCMDTLRQATGQPVRGWLSPARSQSMTTMELLAAAGVDYVCDWVNDEMPYPITTAPGSLVAMPHAQEMSDLQIILQYKRSEAEFTEQLIDQFEVLYREASAADGRIMAVTVHPWIIGQPHRIQSLHRALAHMVAKDGVWVATGGEILDVWQAAQSGS